MNPSGPDESDKSLKVVYSKRRRSNLAATVNRSSFTGLEFPCLARVSKLGGSANLIWLYGYPDNPAGQCDRPESAGPVGIGSIAFTDRAKDDLDFDYGEKVIVEPPKSIRQVRVRLPSARDLPEALSVHVNTETFGFFNKKGKRRLYVLLTAKGMAIPVRLVERATPGNQIEMASTIRAACGLTGHEGWTVQLAELPVEDRPGKVAPAKPSARSGRTAAARLLRRGARLLDILVEGLLRPALKAQPLPFRVVKAPLGDDDLRDTIRLRGDALDALGVKVGGQVFLDWADRQVAVRVLALPDPYVSPELGLAGLDPDSAPVPEDFPQQLLVSIPPSVRRTLNIPPATVIEIRRRLRTAIISQMNQLTIPVVALALAAAVIPDVKWWQILLGAVLALVFGLAPLRIPKPPPGRWR